MYESAQRRFDAHRRAFSENPSLRDLYARWYGQVRDQLPDAALGPWIEVGSGPGLAQEFIPDLVRSDLVPAPWHGLRLSAQALPFKDGGVGALVLFDVLHHLPSPEQFFDEATRVLAPGGRVVLCEPLVTPGSWPVYRFLHEERLDFAQDPWSPGASGDPFDGNQAIPTALLMRQRDKWQTRYPELELASVRQQDGLAYPASGGFGRKSLLPRALWQVLDGIEQRLPELVFKVVGFRMLVVIQRR